MSARSFRGEQHFLARAVVQSAPKAQIARKAADLLPHKGNVFVDAGTSCLAVGQLLIARPELRVYTNSIPLISLAAHSQATLIAIGGEARKVSMALTGGFTQPWLADLRFDAAVFGASGLDLANGAYTSEIHEAAIKGEVLRRSTNRVLVADAEKWSRPTAVRFAPWNAFYLVRHQPGSTSGGAARPRRQQGDTLPSAIRMKWGRCRRSARGFLLFGCAAAWCITGHGQETSAGPVSRAAAVGRLAAHRWLMPTGQILSPAGRQVELPGVRPQAIALSPDGRTLALGGTDNQLLIVNPATGGPVRKVPMPPETPEALGRSLGVIFTTDLSGPKADKLSVAGLVFSPDGTRLYFSNANGSIKVFSLDPAGEVRPLRSSPFLRQTPRSARRKFRAASPCPPMAAGSTSSPT